MSLRVDPLIFTNTYFNLLPSPTHTIHAYRGRGFILLAVGSQAQGPEGRQEDGVGVGAGTRLKSARRPAEGDGCGPACRELSAARRCSRDTSPRRSKRAET